MNGRVKWFNASRGFGFIEGSDEKEYFVHFSNIEMEGYKVLEEGDSVVFDITDTDKGKSAIRVKIDENNE